jgi:eukaryotic-like serine/threonine-protein kinase
MAQQQQRYKVLEKIASGGMAEVFRAESAGLEGFKKLVAIKRVLPHLSEKKQFIGMFLDEARVCAHLSHSNCVQVFDVGVGDNTYFIVMEFVDGSDLKGVIEYKKRVNQMFPVEEACLVCVRILEGLSYAHELTDSTGKNLHIVHRDMSPPNVLLTRFGEVKIVDFGLAKANSQLEKSEPGIIKGKFSYLSPEAAQGLPVDARTDIFAVGIILWELLSGRRLFVGDTDLETVRMVQRAEIPPIRSFNPKVPAELDRIVQKGLAQDPAKRYQTAREFARDINEVMFHLERAVSSFDLATLVQPIWADRAKKKKDKLDKGSIILSLIDEALFEFTSIEGGDRSSKSMVGSAPVHLGGGSFEDVQNWGEDIGYEPPQKGGDNAPMSYELGNLSALEDDDDAPASSAKAPPPKTPAEPRPAARAPSAAAPVVTRASDEPDAPPQKSGGKGGLVAFLLLVVAAGAAAGAYFGGVIPH